jgi:hypothetical protein
MANNRYRVDIPSNPSEIIELLKTIKTKHEALAASSPLGGLKWSVISPSLSTADEKNQLSIQLRRDAETATGARDVEMPVLTEAIRSARDVLMGLNRDNPDALGEFGFDVSDARSGGDSPAPTPA